MDPWSHQKVFAVVVGGSVRRNRILSTFEGHREFYLTTQERPVVEDQTACGNGSVGKEETSGLEGRRASPVREDGTRGRK